MSLAKKDATATRRTDEQRELASRQIINQAVVSDSVVDIFNAVGLDKPNIGIHATTQFIARCPEGSIEF